VALELENDSEIVEEPFEEMAHHNTFQYKVLSDSKKTEFYKSLQLQSKFKKLKISTFYLETPNPLNKSLGSQLNYSFSNHHAGSFLAMLHPTFKQNNILGLGYKFLSENFSSKLFFAYEQPFNPLFYSESSLKTLNSEIFFSYKNGGASFSQWPKLALPRTNHWEISLSNEFTEGWRTQVRYKVTQIKSFQAELDWELKDKINLRLVQTYQETGNSKWTLQYNHFTNSKIVVVSKIDWTHPAQSENEILGVAQALKLNLTEQITLSGGFRMTRNSDLPTNIKSQFLKLQIQNHDYLKIILEWRSYNQEDNNKLQLLLQYGWK